MVGRGDGVGLGGDGGWLFCGVLLADFAPQQHAAEFQQAAGQGCKQRGCRGWAGVGGGGDQCSDRVSGGLVAAVVQCAGFGGKLAAQLVGAFGLGQLDAQGVKLDSCPGGVQVGGSAGARCGAGPGSAGRDTRCRRCCSGRGCCKLGRHGGKRAGGDGGQLGSDGLAGGGGGHGCSAGGSGALLGVRHQTDVALQRDQHHCAPHRPAPGAAHQGRQHLGEHGKGHGGADHQRAVGGAGRAVCCGCRGHGNGQHGAGRGERGRDGSADHATLPMPWALS